MSFSFFYNSKKFLSKILHISKRQVDCFCCFSSFLKLPFKRWFVWIKRRSRRRLQKFSVAPQKNFRLCKTLQYQFRTTVQKKKKKQVYFFSTITSVNPNIQPVFSTTTSSNNSSRKCKKKSDKLRYFLFLSVV